MDTVRGKKFKRKVQSTIIHFGLYKLQLIAEAKRLCPDVVIVNGEDLSRFRNASKQNYAFLRSFSWNSRCEKLGFDEVFMDVSDIIEYNANTLTISNLNNSFFCLSRVDPTVGFDFDATRLAGRSFPDASADILDTTSVDLLQMRLLLASHLAQYLRSRLEIEKGYTATVGISTNKVLAKLVGNIHKPNAQTTLLPPYLLINGSTTDNVTLFMDEHEIGKIPGIGFKTAQKIRGHVLQRPANFHAGLVDGGTKESVLVRDVRQYPDMGSETLERLLGGNGVPHGIGARIWDLFNGCDGTEVGQAREVPTQISIEDSYIRLDTLAEVTRELRMLAASLLTRMHTDLVESDDEHGIASPTEDAIAPPVPPKRWLAHPKTIRLSTRPRPPQNPDGSRNRSFVRISKSAPMPSFVFSLKEEDAKIVERLLVKCLLPLFRRLHPEKSGWNLSLVNIAAANMADAASEKGGVGRDIGKMFRQQDDVLKQWRVDDPAAKLESEEDRQFVQQMEDEDGAPSSQQPRIPTLITSKSGSEDIPTPSQQDPDFADSKWHSEDEDMSDTDSYQCDLCGAIMPLFAMFAHERFHANA